MTYTQIFNELCPTYMAYGMPYKDYWYGDPWMVRAYAQAYLVRRKVDNETAWIHGAYVYAAISAALTTALSKTKKDYLNRPLDFFPKTEAEQEEEKRQKRRRLVEYLSSMRVKSKNNGGVNQNGKP